jgi:hypothetical protein
MAPIKTKIDKQLLHGFIKQAVSHNKHLEEKEMWEQKSRLYRSSKTRSSSSHRSSRHRNRSRSKSPRSGKRKKSKKLSKGRFDCL